MESSVNQIILDTDSYCFEVNFLECKEELLQEDSLQTDLGISQDSVMIKEELKKNGSLEQLQYAESFDEKFGAFFFYRFCHIVFSVLTC